MRPVSASMCWGSEFRISALQLCKLPPFEQFAGKAPLIFSQFLAGHKLFQHARSGAPFAGRRLFRAREPELSEQKFGNLLRGADVEPAPGQPVDLILDAGETLAEIAGQAREHRAVHHDACKLHLAKNGGHGALQCLVDVGHAFGGEPRLEEAPEPQRHIGVFGGVFRRLVHGHAVERGLRLASACHILEGDGRMPEMALRQFIHAEARKAAAALVAGVGHQHGVVVRGDANAVAPHDDEVVFDVLADFQHAVVFEQRLEARERVLHRQLGDLARAGEVEAIAGPMGERNVAGAVWLKRQRDAAKPRGHRIEVRGLGIESDEALFGCGRDPVFKRLKIGDLDVARALEGEGFQLLRHAPRFPRWTTLGDSVSGRFRRRRGFERWRRRMDFTRGGRFDPEGLRDALRQRVEFHGAQEFEERIRVRIFDGGAIERLLDRHVFVEFDKAAGKPGLVSEFRQPLAAHLLLDERRMSEQRFEISVLADQLGGRLDADAGDARHVVDGVARERLHLHHLGGRHAELLQHLRFADHLVLHGVEHGDARLDELHQILVGRDDHNLAAGFHRVARIGRDDVVGLIAFLLDASHIEGAHGVADQRELRHKLRRRIGPVRLVFGGYRVAEARLAVVEDDREMAGPLLALRFTQKLP